MSTLVHDPEFMGLLRLVCIATGFALHIVPLVTMRQVWAAGSTMNFHISTYAFALLNQSVNLWYAIVRKDTALTAHRFFGVVFNAYYVWTFLRYMPPGRAPDFRKTLTRSAACFALVAVDLEVVLPVLGLGSWGSSAYFAHIAFFGAMTGIGLAAGPLATVGEVLRTKDASSLPFPFLAMVTLQCTAWTLYGYLQDDLSTFANNLVGVVLGGMQLGLIWAYPSKRPAPSDSAGKKHESGSPHTAAGSSGGAALSTEDSVTGGLGNGAPPTRGGASGSSSSASGGETGAIEEDVSEAAPLVR